MATNGYVSEAVQCSSHTHVYLNLIIASFVRLSHHSSKLTSRYIRVRFIYARTQVPQLNCSMTR
jgi:hypothetical protein